ncbi:uncharacterized protein [Medicago truncatula]|uniref:uncharacterized protein isoform X2 n=1 Tax=Medicago truncatula TaxID=3880 RepID=UPI000D2F31D8|nr:uncharacterized protein LOC11424271 isoform X2 [Medicago truncatula]
MMQYEFSWLLPMEVMLGSLNHAEVQACSISTVPEELRGPKVEYDYNYKPKFISIGLLHKGSRRQLQLMEELKWNYMCKFLNRQVTEDQNQSSASRLRLVQCGEDILKLDKVVRASYGGNIELEPYEIAKIMILDGCFLLEFLLNLGDYMTMDGNAGGSNIDDVDPIFKDEEKLLFILNDITMLENQIPFIVLKKLYRKVFPEYGIDITNDHRVAKIVREAFDYPLVNTSGVAHILHLMHLSTMDQNEQQTGKRAKRELFRCATKLRAVGITIIGDKMKNRTQNQAKFKDVSNFDINFDKCGGNLVIPTLYVKETTEVKWRNLIAWEQNRIWKRE